MHDPKSRGWARLDLSQFGSATIDTSSEATTSSPEFTNRSVLVIVLPVVLVVALLASVGVFCFWRYKQEENSKVKSWLKRGNMNSRSMERLTDIFRDRKDEELGSDTKEVDEELGEPSKFVVALR
ncbi:hypothetical protein HDV05_007708 [Chytridiales sp. JEL 0842]|nr:hypothetical protein HDV05_007708 [Chytridiales sp. JEL 0842]